MQVCSIPSIMLTSFLPCKYLLGAFVLHISKDFKKCNMWVCKCNVHTSDMMTWEKHVLILVYRNLTCQFFVISAFLFLSSSPIRISRQDVNHTVNMFAARSKKPSMKCNIIIIEIAEFLSLFFFHLVDLSYIYCWLKRNFLTVSCNERTCTPISYFQWYLEIPARISIEEENFLIFLSFNTSIEDKKPQNGWKFILRIIEMKTGTSWGISIVVCREKSTHHRKARPAWKGHNHGRIVCLGKSRLS